MPQINDALFLLRSLLRLKGDEPEEWISLVCRGHRSSRIRGAPGDIDTLRNSILFATRR